MKKILVFLVLNSFLFLNNCGYESIYSKQSGNFHIEKIEVKTNNEINYKIKQKCELIFLSPIFKVEKKNNFLGLNVFRNITNKSKKKNYCFRWN